MIVEQSVLESLRKHLDEVVNTALTEGRFQHRKLWKAVRGHIDIGLGGILQHEQYFNNLDEALAQLSYLKTFPDIIQGTHVEAVGRVYARMEAEKQRVGNVLGYKDRGESRQSGPIGRKEDCYKATHGY